MYLIYFIIFIDFPLTHYPFETRCEMLSKAAHVLRQSKEEHIASGS